MRFLRMIVGVVVLVCVPWIAWAEGITLYLDPAGADDQAGTLDAPIQTLNEAFRRAEGEEELTLILREGEYPLSETLTLGRKLRGAVRMQAYPGETPVLSGARQVLGWEIAVRGGQLLWRAPYPGKELRALYGADGARPAARWPKEGTLQVTRPKTQPGGMFENHRSFYGDVGDLPGSLAGAMVRLTHYWKDELSGVRSYDRMTGLITMNRRTSLSIYAGDTFWLENVLDAPFMPGEWAFDGKEQCLWYAPLVGEDPGETALYAGELELLLALNGISGWVFEGITFTRTAWSIPHQDAGVDFAQAAYDAPSAIVLENCGDVAFIGCTFRDMGAGCIRLGRDVQDVRVEGCDFAEIGAQALYVHGRNRLNDETTRGLQFVGNRVRGYGRNYLNAAAVLLIHARDVDVCGNIIHDGTYTAISAGWVWGTGFNVTDGIRIENNHIYDIGRGILADMGGIYTLGVQPNTRIAGNIIHDVQANPYGGWGIYLDEGASGILVEGNLVYGCSGQGFHQHNGVYNRVENNIFAWNWAGQVGASDKKATGSFLLRRNLLMGEDPFFYRKYHVEQFDLEDCVFSSADLSLEELLAGDLPQELRLELEAVGFIPLENFLDRPSSR